MAVGCAPVAETGHGALRPDIADVQADAPAAAASTSGCRTLAAVAQAHEPWVLPEIRPLHEAAWAIIEQDDDAARPRLADCLLLVDRLRDEDVRVRPLGRMTVAAVRVTGMRRRTNPAWLELERELAEAKRAARDKAPRILRTGEPTVDLFGLMASAVLATIDSLSGPEARIAELEQRLRETPQTLDEEVTTTVPLLVERYRVDKTATLPLVLFEPATGRAWRAAHELHETRTFALLPADAASDLRLPQQDDLIFVSDRAAIEAFAQEPPRARIAELLPALAVALEREAEHTSLAALEAAAQAGGGGGDHIRAEALAAIEPAADPSVTLSPSVVVVRDADGRPGAFGVYIGPEHILTLARTLPPTTLVPVEAAPGLVTYGLVESRDDAGDLALIWVPRQGTPLPLAHTFGQGATAQRLHPAIAVEDELPGAPLATTEGLVALTRGRGDERPVMARELRRFLLRARERDGVGLPLASFGS
jgi:hypothetical protein